jgi:hypothetical protein
MSAAYGGIDFLKGKTMKKPSLLILISILSVFPAAAQAQEEIVFSFTEEEARAACDPKGREAFETLQSEDGQYTLICIYPAGEDEDGRSHPGHWELLRKSEIPEGASLPAWRPVVVVEPSSTGASP